MCSLIASWYSVVQLTVRLPCGWASNSVGHCIVLSFFEIKKASLQMPFTLVIGKFAVQKNATSLWRRVEPGTYCVLLLLLWSNFQKTWKFPDKAKKKKTWQKRFRATHPSIYWRKTGGFAELFLGENQKFSFRLPRKDAAGVTLYNQNTMLRSEGAHSCPARPYISRAFSFLLGNASHRKTADRMLPAAAVWTAFLFSYRIPL